MCSDRDYSWYAENAADVRRDKRLTANAKLMYGDIVVLSKQKGYCYASNAYFAELNDCTEQSVINWLNQLIEYGYIKRVLIYEEGKKKIEERRLYLCDAYSKLIENDTQKNSERYSKEIETTPKISCNDTQKNLKQYSKSEGDTQKNLERNPKNFEKVTQKNFRGIFKYDNKSDRYIKKEKINKKEKKEIATDVGFEEFWKKYPRKVGKKDALEKWNARLAEGVTVEELMNALNNYNRQITENHTEEKYIKHPSTFLSKKRYFDDFKDYHDIREETELSSEKTYKLDLPF
jgi:hypothetical protein